MRGEEWIGPALNPHPRDLCVLVSHPSAQNAEEWGTPI
jgi:hypothetical protein